MRASCESSVARGWPSDGRLRNAAAVAVVSGEVSARAGVSTVASVGCDGVGGGALPPNALRRFRPIRAFGGLVKSPRKTRTARRRAASVSTLRLRQALSSARSRCSSASLWMGVWRGGPYILVVVCLA